MLQPGQRLRFLPEPPQPLGSRQAEPDHFERHYPPRLLLLGFVHRAHAAFAQQPQDAIPSNRWRKGWRGRHGHIPGCYLDRPLFQKAALPIGLFQQRPDLLLERFVAVRGALYPRRSPARVLFQSSVVNSLDLLPPLRLHAASLRSVRGATNSWPSSSPVAPSPPKYPGLPPSP